MAFRRHLQNVTPQSEDIFPWLLDFNPETSADVLEGTIDEDKLHQAALSENLDLSLFDGIMENVSTSSIKDYLEDYKFKGFDLATIKLSFMRRVAIIYPDFRSPDPNVRSRVISLARQDMAKIVAFCINRSMNIDKIENLGSVKNEFVEIIKKYSLKKHLDMNEKDEGLSPQRICMLSGQLYHKMFLLSNNVFRFGKIDNLDPIFHNSLAPAYIPRNSWGISQMKLWTVWCIRFSNQINSNKTEQEKANLMRTTGNIAKIQYEQGASEAERLKYLLTFYERIAQSDNTRFLLLSSTFVMMGLLSCVDDLKQLQPANIPTFDKHVKFIARVVDQVKAQLMPAVPPPIVPAVPAVRGVAKGGNGGNGGGKGGNGGN